MHADSLNAVYTKPSMRRRYEVWFLKVQLADGSGAWWFRYLLMNLRREGGGGCPGNPRGMPVQVWATWFPTNEKPESFIQGFSQEQLSLSAPGATPFNFHLADNRIDEDSCGGRLEVDGHAITWDLRYRSTFGATMSDVGWIGFSRTPDSDAIFSGEITLDGRSFRGDPLGYGLQGHNCGYRHRNEWNWTHCLGIHPDGSITTLEALAYEIGFGMRFRKALLWHEGKLYTFNNLEDLKLDRENISWDFRCHDRRDGLTLTAEIDGSGLSLHRLPYMKTDCSSTFDVANNSLAGATFRIKRGDHREERIVCNGAVLEMGGV